MKSIVNPYGLPYDAFIGENYMYPTDNEKQKFKLILIVDDMFQFECGHWVFRSVFDDMIRCKTGVQNYKQKQQYQLF
jgi:hypothetical protein